MQLQTLSIDDVLQIHNALADDAAASNDPIAPAGLRDRGLLESAINRQFVSFRGLWKYPTAITNAASLTYGICNDHAFYNGNKRTAVVSMLIHLDRNKLCLCDVTQNDLFEMILAVADHKLAYPDDPRKRRPLDVRPDPDEEVQAIVDWIRPRQRQISRGERQIRYRELRRILARFGYSLENPKGNSIDIIRHETVTRGFFRKTETRIARRIGSIGYPGDNCSVSVNSVKAVREICKLREEDGVDSRSFYDNAAVIDEVVNSYRNLLRRLSKY